VKNIANASISQLKEVEGIGDKKAEIIYKILNTEYRNTVIP
jgi:ERCC4-type nuclease